MIDWRERGYVPDSDDEDEDIENVQMVPRCSNIQEVVDNGSPLPSGSARPPHKPTQLQHNDGNSVLDEISTTGKTVVPPEPQDPAKSSISPIHRAQSFPPAITIAGISSQSTATLLEAELQKGLRTVHHVLSSANDGLVVDDNDSDSPLSSPPDSPQSVHGLDPPVPGSANIPDNRRTDAALHDDLVRHLIGRSLRTRNPIQLHPYALEDARYRQSLKERGLRPVRAPKSGLKLQHGPEEESQDAETCESCQTQALDQDPQSTSQVRTTSDEESQSPIRATRTRPTVFDPPLDDDLPELSDLLSGTIPHAVSKTARFPKNTKRRGVSATMISNDDFQIYDLPGDEGSAGTRATMKRRSLLVPPSPPQSRGTLSSEDSLDSLDHLSLPGSTTPRPLPTPLLSSDRNARKKLIEPLSSDSEISIESGGVEDLGSSSESSVGNPQGIQGIRRKIKGVLPASWLKLDINKQQRGHEGDRRHGRSPIKANLEKGVAQRVSRTARPNRLNSHIESRTEFPALFAESDSDEPASSGVNEATYDASIDLADDVVEDNTVDAMLAPKARKTISIRSEPRRRGDTRAKAQLTRDGRRRGADADTRQQVNWTAKRLELKRNSRSAKRVKKKHGKPQMTILEAPGFKEKEVPRFLKIAGRRKARFVERLAQEPARKFFQLSTIQDTIDVNRELELWKSRQNMGGGADFDNTDRALHSQPRCDNKEDPAITFNQPTSELDSLKQATKDTLQRINRNHQFDPSRSTNTMDRQALSTTIRGFFMAQPGQRKKILPGSLQPSIEKFRSSSRKHTTMVRAPKPAKEQTVLSAVRGTLGNDVPSAKRYQRKTKPIRRLSDTRRHSLQDSLCYDGNIAESDNHLSSRSSSAQSLSVPALHSLSPICNDLQRPPKSILQHGMLSTAMEFLKNTLVSSTLTSMTVLTGLFEARVAHTSIRTPISEHAVPCNSWSQATQDVTRQAFVEILSIINSDTSQDAYITMLRSATRSLQTMVTYVNESLYFDNQIQLKSFVQYMAENLETVSHSISSYVTVDSTSNSFELLHMLNNLMLLAYQASRVAMIDADISTKRCTDTLHKLATQAFVLAFRKEYLRKICRAVSNNLEDKPAVSAALVEISASEIETIAIIHKLGCSYACLSQLNGVLSGHQIYTSFKQPDEALAYIIMSLASFCTILGKTEVEKYDRQRGSSLASLGLIALSNAVNAFIPFSLDEQHKRRKDRRYTAMLQRFGITAFQWCLYLVRILDTNDVNNLLRKMFKHYSNKTNNMLDFFGHTRSGAPPFLDNQLPVSDLVPEPHDTDYDLFLKLVAFNLGSIPDSDHDDTGMEAKHAMRKLSLIFSLLPNTGPDVEDDKPLHTVDYHSMANRYLLFVTLYHYSPTGLKPELSQIRGLVKFGKAHSAVCGIVLDCWLRIVKSIVSQPAYTLELRQLGSWIQDMIVQIHEKIELLPVSSTQFDNIEKHLRNQDSANQQLRKLAGVYADAIDLCSTESQATDLIQGDRLDDLIEMCNPSLELDDDTVAAIFRVLIPYIKKCHNDLSPVLEVQQQIRRILVAQLHRAEPLKDTLLASLVDLWFAIAYCKVVSGSEDWDTYLSNWGAYSFPRLASNAPGTHCHILFVSKVVADEEYLKTNMFDILEIWLSSILKPIGEMKFEHIVTNKLLQHAPRVLELAALFPERMIGIQTSVLSFDDFIQQRPSILKHVIRQIYLVGRTRIPAAESSKDQLLRLLRTISRAMNNTWERTPHGERTALAAFMHGLIFELNASPFPEFNCDFSYISYAPTAEDKAIQLEGLFIRSAAQPGRVNYELAVQVLGSVCQLASSREKDEIGDRLGTTFSAGDFNYIDDDGQFRLDIDAQLVFMKAVFPVWLELTWTQVVEHNHSVVKLLCIVAFSVLDSLETRIDLEDQTRMEQFAEVCVGMLVAVGKALQGVPHDLAGNPRKVDLLADLISLCARCCNRWAYLHLLFPGSERLSALQIHVQAYGLYTHSYACSAVGMKCRHSWVQKINFVLAEPDFLDQEEIVMIRDYAVKELGRLSRAGEEDLSMDIAVSRLQVEYAGEEMAEALDLLGVDDDWEVTTSLE
ncbi:uncharacterized protein PV06_07046 [Exophiala oligosperma]|uniref:Uncharacterized protein n=1 Tax=Exophiala oligosperma TaxID=215243 RepID=A0A0D2DGH5_9EURO|nr:uncharacterized protein PV06_07046 [Exophiala oligosperma]KIW41495.1 hypothetical protein PV06_07046 [Exophiala oligosperma]